MKYEIFQSKFKESLMNQLFYQIKFFIVITNNYCLIL